MMSEEILNALNESTLKYFFLILQSDPNTKVKYAPVKVVHHRIFHP